MNIKFFMIYDCFSLFEPLNTTCEKWHSNISIETGWSNNYQQHAKQFPTTHRY